MWGYSRHSIWYGRLNAQLYSCVHSCNNGNKYITKCVYLKGGMCQNIHDSSISRGQHYELWVTCPVGPVVDGTYWPVICMNHWPWILAGHSHIVMHLISMLYTFYTQVPLSCNFNRMVHNV